MSKKPDPGMRCFSNSPTAVDTAHRPRQQSPNTHERAHRAFWQRFLAHALRNGAGGDGDAIPSNLTPGERSIVGTYLEKSLCERERERKREDERERERKREKEREKAHTTTRPAP